MKIAIVTDTYHPMRDGVVACIDIMEEVLNDDGYSTEIVAPDSGNPADHRPGVHYCKSIKLRKYEGYFVPIYPTHMKKLLRDMGADVMNAQGFTVMSLKGIMAAHKLGIPAVLSFHTLGQEALQYYSPIPLPKNLGRKLAWIYLKQIVKWVDIIMTPSPDTERELRDHGITNEIRSIPTPVDTERFRPIDGTPIRERYNLQGKRVMVHVGRVAFEKEINRIIEVMPRLDDDIVLMVVGKGPAMESLKKLTADMGLEDRVIFAGFVPDEELTMHYCAADICVMSSRWETECLTVLQGLACGLPVACADARALRDYMVDGHNGFLFGESPDELVAAIGKAFEAGDDIKANAIATLEPYSYAAYVEKMHRMYEDAVEMKKAKLAAKKRRDR
jgi:1,2-diacylglycerol 3-alpha-glucosyltransferase